MKFFTKKTKEDVLYLKITVILLEFRIKNIQFFYNREHLDLTCQENSLSLLKKKIVNLLLLIICFKHLVYNITSSGTPQRKNEQHAKSVHSLKKNINWKEKYICNQRKVRAQV